MTDNKRRLVLGVLLCATLAATAWVNQQQGSATEIVAVAETKHPTAISKLADVATNDAMPVLQSDKLQARKEIADSDEDVEVDTDLFAAKSWYVPPPPPKPQQALPPPAPVAPPLPFTYMGKMEDGGQLEVYLAKGEKAYTVKAGDTIDGAYKVESMDGAQIVFTYLPMSFKQTLKTGS